MKAWAHGRRSRHFKWISLSIAVLTIGLAISAPPESASPKSDPASLVRRTTLIVHDIDASIHFYRDVLGFELWYESLGKVSQNSLPNEAIEGDPSRFVIMKGRHPWIGMIGLLQYGGARPAPAPPSKLTPGDAVLMLETEELDQIWTRMQAAGTPILRPPKAAEIEGAGGARWRATFLFAWDPDGHLLEINQRSPVVTTTSASPVVREYRPMRWGQIHLHRTTPSTADGMRPPVVLLHQSPLSGRMFSELLPRLGDDRLVFALDTPGYGESDPPPAITGIGDYAEAMHDVIAELKEPVDLVGYHTGALIAAEYAARYPNEVRRLVLVSVPLFPVERRKQLRTTSQLVEDGSHLLTEWKSTMSVRPSGQTLEQAARIVAEKMRAGSRAGWAMAAVATWKAEERLPAIAVPTTIIRPRDGLWDNSGEAAKLIPKARLIDAPQWSYGLFDADPEGVAREIKLALDQTPTAGGI